jgi:iron(III) transport system permease protein
MRDRRTLVLALPLVALLAWLVAYPNASVVLESFAGGGVHWATFLASPADREALVTSVWISVASVVASTAVGLPLALLLARADFPGRRLLSAVATLPAALPPLVGVIAFLFLYGESGVVTRVVQRTLGLADSPWRLSGGWAIVFVHAYTMYVYVFLFVSAALERLDPSLDEAARGLGHGPVRRFVRITLPLLTPALAGGTLLVFMSSLGSFSAPYVFGGGLRVLSTQIVVSRTSGAMGVAFVETTVLAIAAVAGLLLLRWLEGRRRYTVTSKGRPARVPIRSRGARIAAAVASTLLVTVLILPHLMILLAAFAVDGAWTVQVLPPEYTLDNFRALATDPALWKPVTNTVLMTVIATVANVVLCFLIAWLTVLRRFRGRRVLELLAVLPWAIPPTAIAIGLAATFDAFDPIRGKVLLVGTFWILPLAYFIRGLPLVTSAVQSSLRQMEPGLEEAARGLGAGTWQVLRRVVLPAARPGLAAGALLAAITALGEFVATVILFTPANRTISIEVLQQLRQLAFGTASAYSVLLIVLTFALTLAGRWIESRARAGELSAVAGG